MRQFAELALALSLGRCARAVFRAEADSVQHLTPLAEQGGAAGVLEGPRASGPVVDAVAAGAAGAGEEQGAMILDLPGGTKMMG